jgi:GAF domain-containing protein
LYYDDLHKNKEAHMNYKEAIQQIGEILSKNEKNCIQQVLDFLKVSFKSYSWIGIYLVKNTNLQLGPWAGPQATEHTTIPIGYGVCGAAAESGRIENVADVNSDKRYLSCFLSTRSEIVVPIVKNNEVIGEIDIDSDKPNAFSIDDEVFLKKVADMLSKHIRTR